MSLEIFKQNMLSYMQNQQGISSYGDFAKKLTMEYDMAVKRGFDSVNSITIAKGNTELMESTLNGILNTALQQSSGEHPIITNMGPAFIAYWTGATMSSVPPPIIPSPGSTLNVATVSSFITDPGIWQPTDIMFVEPPKPMTSDGNSEESVEDVLKRVPEDNNTFAGAAKFVESTGAEGLTDEGENGGSQLEALKRQFKEDGRLGVMGGERDESRPITESVSTSSIQSQTPPCGTKDNIDYEEKLSPNFKLRHLSIDALFSHRIKSQVGLSERDIICNLKNLAVNILEPLKAKYPTMRVNSAFRGTASIPGGISQHQKGEAVDVQFTHITDDADYMPIAKWVAATLPFDQMIFEHGNSIWLHISCKRGGPQRKQLLTMYKEKYTSGLTLYRKKK